jgi:GNAT superfamily N-acetyltransferase
MKKVNIRLAKREDAKAIAEIVSRWLKLQRERIKIILKALADEDNVILVAERDSQVVGVLHIILYLDIVHGATNCHINLFLVKEGYRGKGIGKSLLNEAIKLARERGVAEIHVDTVFEDAANFYREFGFKDDGIWLELPL